MIISISFSFYFFIMNEFSSISLRYDDILQNKIRQSHTLLKCLYNRPVIILNVFINGENHIHAHSQSSFCGHSIFHYVCDRRRPFGARCFCYSYLNIKYQIIVRYTFHWYHVFVCVIFFRSPTTNKTKNKFHDFYH